MVRRSQFLHTGYKWLAQFGDPIRMIHAIRNLGWYFGDWRRYKRMHGAEPLRLLDSWPQLHDRMCKTPFDAHDFWTGGWAMRRILSQQPKGHVDIGSQVMFVNLLSAVVPVTFVDYRPLEVRVEGLNSCSGDILHLPFPDQSIESLSCLHVAEHIGLGRYGDPLNPQGARQACAELQRVLAPGGNLYFALPIGTQRVCFNAHRIHMPQTILGYFAALELIEFSAVRDDGRYAERASIHELADSRYACGLFHFRRSAEN